MLILFFTITFIAELIVAEKVISWVRNTNQKINTINNQVLEIKPTIQEKLSMFHENVTKVKIPLCNIALFVTDKKDTCTKFIEKDIFSEILAIFLKIPFKQIISTIELIITIRKLLKV